MKDFKMLKFKFIDGEIIDAKYVDVDDIAEFHKEQHKEIINGCCYYCLDAGYIEDEIISKYNMIEDQEDNSFVLVEEKYVLNIFIE